MAINACVRVPELGRQGEWGAGGRESGGVRELSVPLIMRGKTIVVAASRSQLN
jgi:hypothetical protein